MDQRDSIAWVKSERGSRRHKASKRCGVSVRKTIVALSVAVSRFAETIIVKNNRYGVTSFPIQAYHLSHHALSNA